MKEFHGYFWPDIADANVLRYIQHANDMKHALKHALSRSTVVQAGGHCGLWPLWLSKRFERVFTFEPNPDNFACLQRNCEAQIDAERIFAVNACLGESPSKISMSINGKNTGGHKGTKNPGETIVVTIDGLQLATCDLIVLDIEGMELPALKGAERTINDHSPVLMLEDRGHGDRHGWGSRNDLFQWLAAKGYKEKERVSYDVVLTRTNK
jgi:FkbM family methyltransferase